MSTNFQHQSVAYYRSTTMLSPTRNTSNQLHNEWKYKAKCELKTKIQGNYVQRANTSVKTINTILKQYINTNIPMFVLSRLSVTNTLRLLFYKVDQWQGVDISATRSKLKTFNQYMKRADNWWNRYKAEWIGDYFFTILFNMDLKQYINSITNNNCRLCNQQITLTNGNDNINRNQLLLFLIIQGLMHSEVKFKRAKNQPLILDQCYSKSTKLQQYFKLIGAQHSVEWMLPPNVTETKNYRIIVRKYAGNWIDKLISSTLSSINVNKIENINFGMFICNHEQQQECTYTNPQSNNQIPIQNPPCTCNITPNNCSECNTIINNMNINQVNQAHMYSNINTHITPPLISNNYNPIPIENTFDSASDNSSMITRPFTESSHYYQPVPSQVPVAMYRPHPYAQNINSIPITTHYNYNYNYNRVRGPSMPMRNYISDTNIPCYNQSQCQSEYINPTFTETVILDPNFNNGETMTIAEPILPFFNDDETDNVFTNYSFEDAFN